MAGDKRSRGHDLKSAYKQLKGTFKGDLFR